MNRALRVGLYSSNSTVRSLLTSALNSEYCFVTDFGAQPVSSILKNRDDLDVLVIDFDSRSCTLEQQLAAYDEIGETSVPIIVMTDDLRRSTAMEFLRRGAFDCIRKPPSLAEF